MSHFRPDLLPAFSSFKRTLSLFFLFVESLIIRFTVLSLSLSPSPLPPSPAPRPPAVLSLCSSARVPLPSLGEKAFFPRLLARERNNKLLLRFERASSRLLSSPPLLDTYGNVWFTVTFSVYQVSLDFFLSLCLQERFRGPWILRLSNNSHLSWCRWPALPDTTLYIYI